MRTRLRTLTVVGSALLLIGGLVGPVSAAEHQVVLPAGLACAGFDLGIDGMTSSQPREFHDRDGNVVKTITAGKGDALTFTNIGSGAFLSLRANGYASITVPGPGDLTTTRVMGHTVIILFPTDVPAGPSTTLYVGRVTYTADAQANFHVLSTSGTRMDICAALAG